MARGPMGTKSQSAAVVGNRSFLGNDSLSYSTLVAAGKVCAVELGYFDLNLLLLNKLKRGVAFSILHRLTVPESKFCVMTGTRGPPVPTCTVRFSRPTVGLCRYMFVCGLLGLLPLMFQNSRYRTHTRSLQKTGG